MLRKITQVKEHLKYSWALRGLLYLGLATFPQGPVYRSLTSVPCPGIPNPTASCLHSEGPADLPPLITLILYSQNPGPSGPLSAPEVSDSPSAYISNSWDLNQPFSRAPISRTSHMPYHLLSPAPRTTQQLLTLLFLTTENWSSQPLHPIPSVPRAPNSPSAHPSPPKPGPILPTPSTWTLTFPVLFSFFAAAEP